MTQTSVTKFKCNPKEFLLGFVTVDETWIYCYQRSVETEDFTSLICFEERDLVRMAAVFWDSQGAIFTDYLEEHKTVTPLYYTADSTVIRYLDKSYIVKEENCNSYILVYNIV